MRIHLLSLFTLLFILFSCQNQANLDSSNGKVELIIMRNTKFEKKITYSKKFVIKELEFSNNKLASIYLNTRFCKEIDKMNLGALNFELLFYDSNNNVEISFCSFSKASSIRPVKKCNRIIRFNESQLSYFPDTLIKLENDL